MQPLCPLDCITRIKPWPIGHNAILIHNLVREQDLPWTSCWGCGFRAQAFWKQCLCYQNRPLNSCYSVFFSPLVPNNPIHRITALLVEVPTIIHLSLTSSAKRQNYKIITRVFARKDCLKCSFIPACTEAGNIWTVNMKQKMPLRFTNAILNCPDSSKILP